MIQKNGAEWDERVGRTSEQGAALEKDSMKKIKKE